MSRLEDEPFRPFRVHLSDGSSIEVPQAGMVIVGKSTAVLPSRFEFDEEGRRIAARWRTIALLHIVQFSDLNEPRGGNGKGRKAPRPPRRS